MPSTIITLLTDFGYKDHYVGVMKGVILRINPQIKIVDISHNISPHNVLEGAITLSNAFSYFPKGTIHVAVVDPGVGSKRKSIVVSGKDYIFVGPDNGIFGLVYNRLKEFKVYELTNPRFFLNPVSATFHGRDIFAPTAAYLSMGFSPLEVGEEINKYQKISMPVPDIGEKIIKGNIIYFDFFGNAITNINQSHLKIIGRKELLKVKIGEKVIPRISHNYQDVEKGEALALIGSSEFLEISVREGNANKLLGLKEGDEVLVLI
jgi:hypothetical protein